MFTLALTLLMVPLVWLLQAAAPDFPIPGWLIGSLPVLGYALTETIVRLGGDLTGQQKRAIHRAACLLIVGGLMLFGNVDLPFSLPAAPADWLNPDSVGAYVDALLVFAAAAFGFVWGGGKVLHDLLDAAGVRA